jgi:hypothetical protein
VVPAASGFGSTEVHPATIPGRSMGERRWQHILALYYRRNGPHPALIDRHMHDEPQTVYVGLIGLGLLSMTSGATFSHAPRHHSNRLLTKLREIRHRAILPREFACVLDGVRHKLVSLLRRQPGPSAWF